MATILLVEDSSACAELVQEALTACGRPDSLSVVGDGESALAFLRQQGQYADAHWPDLIPLDLNLPKKDGRGVLVEIKADEHLGRIPVVILTTSDAERDVTVCYNLHANGYVVKPFDLAGFFSAIQSIVTFWLDTAALPRKRTG
jgi:chemotaxis family two-component system response regulator Rcp1